MTIKELVSKIAKAEGLKHEASVGDIREIVGIVSDVLWKLSEPDCVKFVTVLVGNGKRRSRRKRISK
jgi:hypothetical protein